MAQCPLTRRALLAAGAALAAAAPRASAAETQVPLWPDRPPGAGGPDGPPDIDSHGAVSAVSRPSLTLVAPARPSGIAMLVAAGGGYKRIENEREALPAARWLADRGITAFVLTYRLPAEGWADGPLAPLQDAQRALRLIRAGVAGVPAATRLGVLGFSAGGHLMGLAATRSAFASYPPVDAADRLSARPDAAALIYPVITLEPPFDHTSTRRSLVGAHPDPSARAEWSVQTHVAARCPPVFLVQAADDPISDPDNSRIMAEACRRGGIPVELHILPSGGHGFAMGRPGTPSAAWPDWYAAWLGHEGFTGM